MAQYGSIYCLCLEGTTCGGPEQFQTTSTAFLWAPSQRPGGHGLCAEQVTAHGPLKVNTPPHTKKQNKLTCIWRVIQS